MNDMDDRISAALHAAVDGLREQDLRPATSPVEEQNRRQHIRWVAPLLTAAAVAAAIVTTFALTSSPSASPKHQQGPGGPGPSPAPTTVPSYEPSAVRSSPQGGSTVPAPSLPTGDEPLWPFGSAAEAGQWENVDGPAGHSPWHADAKATALFFVTGYLQFHDITEVTSVDIGASQADIGVGYDLPSGDKHTASVLHLVRFGDANAPWEVVRGTADGLSISSPSYGDEVTAPVPVSGQITGVDENITAWVFSLDGEADASDRIPAGGENAAWDTIVPYSEEEHGVLSIVASTGGHLTAHERFAVVGVTTQ